MLANQSTGPTGSLTLDRVFGDGTQIGFLFQNFLITLGTAYTFSIFLKKSNSSQVLTLFYGADFNSGGANPQAIWNLDTGVATFSNNCSGGMIPYPNNIYRCYITVTATRTASTSAQFLRMSSLSGDAFAGGAQLQTGSTLGPYVPTTTTAASSTADVWSITGADAARIINGTQFTVYMDGYRTFTGDFPDYPNFYAISDGSSSNLCTSYGAQGNQLVTNYSVLSNSVSQTDFVGVSLSNQQSMKIVQALSANDSRFGVNGTLTAADTSVTMPVGLNKISIGSNAVNGNPGNFYIRELAIFRSRHPNANLQAMIS